MLVWSNLEPEVQSQYYQGLTDVFEVLFAAFIDTELLNGLIENISEEEYDRF